MYSNEKHHSIWYQFYLVIIVMSQGTCSLQKSCMQHTGMATGILQVCSHNHFDFPWLYRTRLYSIERGFGGLLCSSMAGTRAEQYGQKNWPHIFSQFESIWTVSAQSLLQQNQQNVWHPETLHTKAFSSIANNLSCVVPSGPVLSGMLNPTADSPRWHNATHRLRYRCDRRNIAVS